MKLYIAKDEDGRIFLYSNKPQKAYEYWDALGYSFPITELPEGANPQWEDDEPIEVELKIKKA